MSEEWSIEEIIEEIIKLKENRGTTDNEELAIFYFPEFDLAWQVELGNPVNAVSLGESAGEFKAIGKSMREALLNLYEQLGEV